MTPYRILSFDTLGSTNDEAMARLKAGEGDGFFVAARSQTGGRGRQGRTWQSPPGNLYASLALRDPAPVQFAPQLGFVAGVALANALRQRLADDPRLQIKWPNDIVVAGAKLAGILLECAVLPERGLACVVGFGVNCLGHPENLMYPATDLVAAGDPTPAPDAVLAGLADAMAHQLRIWDRGAGFAAVRAVWLAMAAGIGERIIVNAPNRTVTGVFRDLDETGRLLVETAGGLAAVEAGDVFLPGVAMAVEDHKHSILQRDGIHV